MRAAARCCGGGGIGKCPYTNWNNIYSFNDAISKVQGKHNLKAGIYIERTEKVQHGGQSNYTGAYNFASGGAAMTADTQDGYANAYLGNFNSYNEGPRDIGDWWFWQVEAFVQDNWRVSRRLTLDLGVRFYHMPAIANINTGVNGTAVFVPSAYSAAAAERIYYPGCTISTANGTCPAADEYAIDPATGYKTFYIRCREPWCRIRWAATAPRRLRFPAWWSRATTRLPHEPVHLPVSSPRPRVSALPGTCSGMARRPFAAASGMFLNRGDFDTIAGAAGQSSGHLLPSDVLRKHQ